MKRHLRKLIVLAGCCLPGLLPLSCSTGLLEQLTPFLIDGSNSFMRDVIFTAAPLVLP